MRNEQKMGKRRQLTGSDSETKNPSKGFDGNTTGRRTPEEATVARNWQAQGTEIGGGSAPKDETRRANR